MRALAFASVLALVLAPALALGQQPETEIASIEAGAHAEVAWTGLEAPVDIVFGPDGTMYYAEFETGKLRQIPPGAEGPAPDALWSAPNLQLGGERGFVGLALAPDFATSHAFYVNYQTNKTGTIVTRLSRVVGGQETVLLDDIRSEKLHNSGRIAFLPDGNLLMSVGDATLDTIGRDASMHAHDPTDLNGKVLRLTPEGEPVAGNAWGNEVFTKGHRNVYGLAVAPDGTILATENGPDHYDEVNLLVGGKDYGWPTCSGPCDKSEYVDPILEYYDTIAPTGAVWYKDSFYFSDFNKGRVHRVHPAANGSWYDERVVKFTTPRILDIAVGPDALYLSTWDSVWRVTPGPAQNATLPVETPSTGSGAPTPPTESTSATPAPTAAAGRGVPGPGVWAAVAVAAAALARGRRNF
ncbi:MAG TPA: PQQ-dependent sugar dehydrogenase [Candidatus Thermoplasmatota archaeon]|nr:PQQ-dependent sugar dehydrogenase [Candidatus Thermoplasmatota archaeon]